MSQNTEQFIDIVFDGPPPHESGRFIEVEDAEGRSINVGTWLQRTDGYWVLRLSPPPTPDVERLTWQPIATCPVGERVLIGGGGCPRVHENELRDFRSAGRAFAGLGDAEQPTHWMPLPDRPVAGDTPTPGGEQPR